MQAIYSSMFRALCGLMLSLAAISSHALADATYSLQSQCRPGDLSRVQVTIEVGGELLLSEKGETRKLPLNVSGNLTYFERLLDSGSEEDPRRSVRWYEQAQAAISINGATLKPLLREERRLIAAYAGHETDTLLSPAGPLTRDEIDLLDTPGSSLLVHHVLPTAAVRVGENWRPDEQALAALLGIDAIGKSDVEITLTEVVDGLAKLSIAGKVEGAVGGVSTAMDIKGRCNFDLNTKVINWFAVSINEQRAIGNVAPGLDVVAKIRVQLTPDAKTDRLPDAVGASLPADPAAADSMISYESKAKSLSMPHDRRWHVTADTPELIVMRLVDRGALVAQCNLSLLKPLAAGKTVSLAEFQGDVQRSLGKNFQQFVAARESTDERGFHTLRAVAAGMISEVPIEWRYYLVTSPDGQRLALAFTLEGNSADQFAEADLSLISSIQFLSDAANTAGLQKATLR